MWPPFRQTLQRRTDRVNGRSGFVWLLSCGILVLASLEVLSADRSTTREQVEDLIHRLDSNTLMERRSAERQLLDLGPEILPLLPPPDLVESVPIREAIRRIRPQLERRAARESSGASRVSFTGESTLRELLNQIQQQSKNQVFLADAIRNGSEQRIRVTWDKSSFWDCLEDLCQQSRLQWQFAENEAAIRLFRTEETRLKQLAVQRTGPFRITIDNTEIRALVGDEAQRILRITGRISVEPRLRPLFLSMAAMDLSATVNQEVSLTPWNPNAKYEFPVSDGGREVRLQWDFRLPKELKANTVAIRGPLHCQIAAATERIVFDQKSLARPTIRRRGGVSVRLRQATFEATESDMLNAEIGITVSYDNGGPAFESHRTWMFHNAVYLETASKLRINFTDFDTTQQSDGAVAVDYRWKKIPAPSDQYLFVYEAPTLIVDVPIDIDLGQIPITE